MFDFLFLVKAIKMYLKVQLFFNGIIVCNNLFLIAKPNSPKCVICC